MRLLFSSVLSSILNNFRVMRKVPIILIGNTSHQPRSFVSGSRNSRSVVRVVLFGDLSLLSWENGICGIIRISGCRFLVRSVAEIWSTKLRRSQRVQIAQLKISNDPSGGRMAIVFQREPNIYGNKAVRNKCFVNHFDISGNSDPWSSLGFKCIFCCLPLTRGNSGIVSRRTESQKGRNKHKGRDDDMRPVMKLRFLPDEPETLDTSPNRFQVFAELIVGIVLFGVSTIMIFLLAFACIGWRRFLIGSSVVLIGGWLTLHAVINLANL
jgi:hypothetical protein